MKAETYLVASILGILPRTTQIPLKLHGKELACAGSLGPIPFCGFIGPLAEAQGNFPGPILL